MSSSSPALRAAIALLLFSGWMGLLFAGVLPAGAVHLLLLGALALFPWRALPPPSWQQDEALPPLSGPPAEPPPPTDS